MTILEADYIVVGGGLTGCALAARIQQKAPSLVVLLLEAGVDASDNPQTRDLAGGFALAGTDLDYKYKTVPQSNTEERIHNITAGRVLGGGSILNYGGWARGDAADYNQWAKAVGDQRWSYQGLLPYMKMSENHYRAKDCPQQRGSNGPMRVVSVLESDPKRKYGLRQPIKRAWEELGLHENPKADCGSLKGICSLLENWNDGQRQPSNIAYNLEKVKILTSATVHKVEFGRDQPPTASGVLLTDGRQIKARKEVILSAGTIKTPQILMLSGIGPADLLKKHDIPVIHQNEEVGKNYIDHFALFQVWKLRNPEKGLSMGTPLWNDQAFFKGMPCDWAVNDCLPSHLLEPSLRSDAASGKESDDSLLGPDRCHIETMVVYSPVGAPVPMDGSYIATSVMLLVPTSRGSISITSSSLNDAPDINPNYFDTEFDRKALIYGTRRVVQALLGTSEGKAYVEAEGSPPGIPALTMESSDAEIEAKIRKTGQAHFHPAGTAAMGKVVDSDLCVYGTKGLRVVDASILPVAIGGHPQATIYAVAEQAADIIVKSS